MKKDYIITFVTEFLVLISGILVYKLAADLLGKDGFSEYALSRRTIAIIQPCLLLGLGVGLPRYIAYAWNSTNPKKSDAYFISGVSILAFVGLTATILLSILRNTFAFLMFGSSDYAFLIFPIILVMLSLAAHGLCYSYFRGKLLMFKANLLQMINIGIAPVLAFFLGRNVSEVLTVMGGTVLIVSVFFLILIIRGVNLKVNILPHAKELVLYGVQRVPGDFGLAALFTLPATFTAHMVGLREAGFVAFGLSFLNMAGNLFAPIGIVLLPKASQLIASGDFKLLRYYISRLMKITLLLTLTGVLFFEIFADPIIGLYLGKDFSEIVLVSRLAMIGGVPYSIYVSMRSIIDAFYFKSINTRNILVSLGVFLISSFLMYELSIIAILHLIVCFLVSIFILGILTILDMRKICSISA